MTTERFDRHPYVCGAIGMVDAGDLRRLVAASPPTGILVAEPRFTLRTRGRVEALSPSGRGWAWGGVLPGTAGDADPFEARLCAGAVQDLPGAWSVVGDPLGMQHLYRRVSGNGFLFAGRIEPLVRAVAGRVHADWGAWSTIIALGSPLGASTPFVEVRRWSPAESVSVGRDGRVTTATADPAFLAAGRPAATPAEIVDGLIEGLPDVGRWRAPPSVPLSGGSDSRLLAALARGKYRRRPLAVATTTDVGHETDLALAPAVASALRMRYRVVLPDRRRWIDDATETRERVEYQTWYHPWFMALARAVHRARLGVISGFAGGILLKGHMVDAEVLAADDWDTALTILFRRLGHTREWLSSSVVTERGRALAEHALDVWRTEARRFSDHPNGLTLAYLYLRGVPALGPMPMQLVAPEVDVFTPYVAPGFLAAALSVPPDEKLDGKLMLRILDLAAPDVARLPSTNDPAIERVRVEPRQASVEARAWMAGLVESSPAARSLASRRVVRRALHTGDAGGRRAGTSSGRVLLSLSMLAQWQERYADVLDPADRPPWSS